MNNSTELPKGEQLIGDETYPYHLSAGLLAVYEGKIAVIKRNMVGKGVIYLLPKETVKADETFREAALRGLKEEVGGIGRLIKFVGSYPYQFQRDNTQIYKTVVYFLVEVDELEDRIPEESEKDDEIIWAEPEGAKRLLSNVGNPKAFSWERDIVDRLGK